MRYVEKVFIRNFSLTVLLNVQLNRLVHFALPCLNSPAITSNEHVQGLHERRVLSFLTLARLCEVIDSVTALVVKATSWTIERIVCAQKTVFRYVLRMCKEIAVCYS
jgi:hypothetical protein